MSAQYPSVNDTGYDLVKKIANNTADIDLAIVSDVNSVAGTANQVLVNGGTAAATGNVTVSLPTALTAPGSLTVTTTFTLTAQATDNGVLHTNGSGVVTSTLTPSGLTSIGVNTVSSAAASTLILATGTFGTAVTFASATGVPTFAAGAVFTGALSGITNITMAGALTGCNSVTSVAGTALTLGTGTFGGAFSMASATGFLTLTGNDAAAFTTPQIWIQRASGNTAGLILNATGVQRVASDGTTASGLTINGGGGNITMGGTGTVVNILGNTDATTGGAGAVTLSAGGLYALGKIISGSSFTSGTPNGGTSGAWKFGIFKTSTLVALDTANWVELDIGGTLRRLALITITTP